MGLTQKYKQQQQQVRVLTNESNYIKGMYFTDVPLAEGYSRVLVNFDIDSLSGKLTPRKGLQSLGYMQPGDSAYRQKLNTGYFAQVLGTHIGSVPASVSEYSNQGVENYLQSIVWSSGGIQGKGMLSVLTSPEVCTGYVGPDDQGDRYHVDGFTAKNSTQHPDILKWNTESIVYKIPKPGIHNKQCVHPYFMQKPAGAFAFGDGYYTFVKKQIFNEDGSTSLDPETPYILCYTKLGRNIDRSTEKALFTNQEDRLYYKKYYVLKVTPDQLNPTEASSWGYNMLLKDPYNFDCEETAVNLVTILGVIPYDKNGEIALTPRKNQQITLKGYFRAPKAYYSEADEARYYATAKQEDITKEELDALDANEYEYGNWWHVTDEVDGQEIKKYYILVPEYTTTEGVVTATKKIIEFGDSKPAASEKLGQYVVEGSNLQENKIRVRWQMRSAEASDWIDISNELIKLSEYYNQNGEKFIPFSVTATIPSAEALIKLTISDPSDPDDPDKVMEGEEYVLSTNTIGLSLVSDDLANSLNIKTAKYNLGECTGMCEWSNHLVLWGVPKALNTLFVSDVNNPGYFPYPNNVDVFTEPIMSVHNYGNELLVLTTTCLYRLSWDAEGTGWTHKLVQRNLHITEADIPMAGVIKNMFYFKSGNYYYMMVPRAASNNVVGDVTIAPISKPIEGLLDNFHNEIYNLVKVMVDQDDLFDFTEQLVKYSSYIDNTRIVFNYAYDLIQHEWSDYTKPGYTNDTPRYLYVQLIYDTDARTWSIKIFENTHILCPSHPNAVQQDQFVDIIDVWGDNTFGQYSTLQYYKLQNYTDTSIMYISSNGEPYDYEKIFKNYQYLDTGNREINTEMKKRFREFQFKIKNKTATNLGFYNAFLVDGSLRKDLQHYNPRLISDPTTGEQYIVVERTLNDAYMLFTPAYVTTRIERILVPERMLQDNGELTPTTLAEETDPDRWILDQSALPGRTLWKIRMPISGKGYTPRAILLSTNEAEYEILGNAWVYRTMHAR